MYFYGGDVKLNPDLSYSRDHLWISFTDDIAIIGLMQESVDAAQEIVFIDLPQLHSVINSGERLLSVESLKSSLHLPSPVSGEVVEVNDAVFDEPNILNANAYNTFICKMRVIKKGDVLSAEEAKTYYENK